MPDDNHNASSRATLSIGALSRATGVPVETLRTWERRYGFPDPGRNGSGHREYDPRCVEHIRLIDEALQGGHRPANVVGLAEEDLRELLNITAHEAEVAIPLGVRDPTNTTVKEWLQATHDFDGPALEHLFRHDWMRLGPIDFLTQRVDPFLYELGSAWAERRLAVAHEHFASERLRDFLTAHWRPLSDRATGPTVVCATLPGEGHALGLQMVAVIFATAGWQIVYLGADAPVADIARTANEREVVAVLISVSVAANRFMARRELTKLREQLADPITLMVGGMGAPDGLPNVLHITELEHLARWTEESR